MTEALHDTGHRDAGHSESGRPTSMGYQPGLDGVRAFSVVAVIFYHAGFSWMHGGFFGVEVFFVVSGFLITSLLIEERDRADGVNLRQFWVRRWRRLLPALFTMMIVVGAWAAVWGSAEQHSQLRHDYPWGLGYLANWGQIFSQESYWGAGSPSLFRHLWSLAVEEQWYVLWPLAFILLARRTRSDRRRALALGLVAMGVMVATAVASAAQWPTRMWHPFRMEMVPVDPTNFLYLSTFSRSSGLLLGAAMAFRWRPWSTVPAARRSPAVGLQAAAFAAVGVLIVAFVIGRVDAPATYRWLLPTVTIASAVLVGVVVHPAAATVRAAFSAAPMVAIGRRSYGLYLWSWPISRICDAYSGSWPRFLLAMAVTAPVSEACYRWVETPIRRGGLSTWWSARRRWSGRIVQASTVAAVVAVAGLLSVFFASAAAVFDPAKDTSGEVAFDGAAATPPVTAVATVVPPVAATTSLAGSSTSAGPEPTADAAATAVAPSTTVAPATTVAPSTTLAALPRRVVIVGDSTAHSLAINLPAGIDGWFEFGDGSLDGCSVYSDGTAVSALGFTRSFDGCSGWEQRWASAATRTGAELALVVIGAWDVFDVELDDQVLAFDSPAGDQRFVDGVQRGIDALTFAGVRVALLEVPCMRPQNVKGAGVPALPERGDDARVAHVNDLLRDLAAANPATTTFVSGPTQYCTDESIASDLGYRWDGVHAYKPGAKLTLEAIAGALLAIPIPVS